MCCFVCMPQVQPDWLFISTWNELLAQPQVPVVPPYKSMGLETDNTSSYFTFVGERSRTTAGCHMTIAALSRCHWILRFVPFNGPDLSLQQDSPAALLPCIW